jgi:hypothetical protein
MSKEWIGPGAQLIGQAGKVFSGISAASAISGEAKTAANNAMASAGIGMRQTKRQADRVAGKQKAITAASGLAVSGTNDTPIEVMMDSAKQAQLQIELIKRNGMIDAEAAKQRGRLAKAAAMGKVTEGFGGMSIWALQNETLINELIRKATGGGANPYDIHDADMAGIYD